MSVCLSFCLSLCREGEMLSAKEKLEMERESLQRLQYNHQQEKDKL